MTTFANTRAARNAVVAIAGLVIWALAPAGRADAQMVRPAYQATPVLLYRAAPDPARTQQGVAMWIFNDGSGGSFRVRAMASGGQSSAPENTPGAGMDRQPTWPAWISAPIPFNWRGWKRIEVAKDAMTYRAPTCADPSSAPASFSDADTVGIDTTRRSGVLFVSMLEWTGPDRTEATACLIDDFFASSASAWTVAGTPEAQSALALKTGILPPRARLGHLSMKLSFAAAAMADAASMTYLKQAVALSTRPCLVLIPKSPFIRQLADATPASGDANPRIQTFACPDQYQSASFNVYAIRSLTSVSVHPVGSLAIPGHNMPAGAVDATVVKVVKQHGDGQYADYDIAGASPSMLLKDDRAPLSDAGGELPVVRTTGDPVTDISAHTQKQFWLTVDVPRDTPPGDYTQQLRISGNQFAPFMITLEVDVLKLRLMSSSKQYAIAFVGKLEAPPVPLALGTGSIGQPSRNQTASGDPDATGDSDTSAGAGQTSTPAVRPMADTAPVAPVLADQTSAAPTAPVGPGQLAAAVTEYLSPAQFQIELTDIADHGFRYVTLTDRGPALWDAESAYTSIPGLGYPFLYSGFTSEREAEQIDKERNDRKVDPFYFLDLNHATAGTDTAAMKAAGIESALMVPDDGSATPDDVDSADLAIYRADDPYVKRLAAGGQRTTGQRDWLAWNSDAADPRVNRLYTGFLLFRTNMYGAFALSYENANGGDPFDDAAPRDGAHAGMRAQMVTYPVQGGVVDTVGWEACREGITDTRYLTTFYAALRECKDNHVDRAIVPIYESRVKAILAQPFWSMTDAGLQADRFAVAMYALRLRTDVDAYYARTGQAH